MMKIEQQMLKGFVTAASLGSEDKDLADRSVRMLQFSALIFD